MKETIGGIVTLEVLQMRGKFTKKDIFDKVVPKIEKYFSNKQDIEKYLDKKIECLCDYSLLGRTDVYFFEI
mgnify:FL=1